MFRFTDADRDGILLLNLEGHLDATSAPSLKSFVIDLDLDKTSRVVVDLSPLTLIDSTGVGVLISLFKRLRSRRGAVFFAGLSGQPREIFRLLRLDRSLDIATTIDEALEKIRSA